MSLSVWFDGGCTPHNPGGHGTYGFVIKQDGQLITEQSGYLGKNPDMTNNVAEYTAVIEALDYIYQHELNPDHIHIHGDSELIINQIKGDYNVYSPRLRPLHVTVTALIDRLEAPVQVQWIDRENNTRADELATEAYRNQAYQQQELQAREEPVEIIAVGENAYKIDGEHVEKSPQTCTCEDYQEHGAKCRHIFKAELLEQGCF